MAFFIFCTQEHTHSKINHAPETGTLAFDGYAGFRVGQVYQLRIERRGGQVAVALDHPHCAPGGEMVVSEAEFERWWVR